MTRELTNPRGDPDVQLMLQVQQGDQLAFRSLLERNHQRVLNLAYRYLRDRSQAEDVVQETFLKLYKARERYQPNAKFRSYLLRIASNVCLSKLRKKSPSGFLGNPDDDRPEAAVPDPKSRQPKEVMLRSELRTRIQEAVERLPERQRMAILLNKFEGLEYKEVADHLGLSVSATKSLLHRARMALKSELQGYVNPGLGGAS